MNSKILLILSTIMLPFGVCGASPWEGSWELGRYSSDAAGGSLRIENCKDNVCDFEFVTANGAHTCNFEGKLKIKGRTAQYWEIIKFVPEEKPEAVVDFELDTKKNIIKVTGNDACHYFCGMQGYFEGEYENSENPLRHKTSFDCWADDLDDAEKTVCAEKRLANADNEMAGKYQTAMTDEWKIQRRKCGTDVDCLWDFYVDSIKTEYQKTANKYDGLYEYLGSLEEDGLYYPTNFVLLDDYFRKNMEQQDYEEFVLNFSQVALGKNQCENCFYHMYGVAGLYTIMESAFYINANEIWIAFLHADYEHKDEEYIIMYGPMGKTLNDIPEQFEEWLKRLKEFYPNGIKLKYFAPRKVEAERV